MSADWELLASLGLSVFPIQPHSKRPVGEWGRYQTQRADDAQVAQWAAATNLNVGIATGAVSGCIVLDLDNAEALLDAMERGLPETMRATTPRGYHYFFQHPGGRVTNRAGQKPGENKPHRLPAGMDIRGDGGYVVGSGSYFIPDADERGLGKVEGPYALDVLAALAPVPDWLRAYLTPEAPERIAAPERTAEQTSEYGQRALLAELRELADAARGHNLSDQIYKSSVAIGELVAGGEIVHDEAVEAIMEALAGHGVADEDKANETFRRAFEKGLEHPRAQAPAITPDQAFGAREAVAPSPPAEPGEQPVHVPAAPLAFGPDYYPQLVTTGEVARYFQGCVYVAAENAMWVPGGVLLKREAFNVIYGGPTFLLGAENSKSSKSAWDMFSNNETVRLPRAMRTVFRPECEPGALFWLDGLPVLNAYNPISTPAVAGDASPFVQHVHKLLPVGRDADILLHWMASCVQNPGAKFQWWPVVQGTKGNGKTLLLEVMFEAIGERYSHLVNAEALQRTGNQFNAWIDRKLFLGFEEIHTGEGQHHFTDMMKTTVTNRRIAAEGKGVAQGTVDNRAQGIMLTNHRGAVPIDDDERRYGIFHTAQQSAGDLARDGMTGSYFPDLYDWLRAGGYAIVTHYLKTYPLRDEMDPARGWRAPVTSSTADAKADSLGNVELEILERIEQGAPGFRGGWISSVAFASVMERMKIGRKRWPIILRGLGFEAHPHLKDGRVSAPMADGTKPRLYVTVGHPSASLSSPAMIVEAYEADQVGQPTSNVVPIRPPLPR